jgi:hypothetical protein
MMEKYGVEKEQTYEVVKGVEKIGSDLSLAEANELQKMNPGAIVKPE